MNKNTLQIFQIDAFTSEVFKGNPACVMPLEQWLPDDILLNIAKENNVSESEMPTMILILSRRIPSRIL